ncbi:MAG: FtsX-like permease family protein [Clostridiaceae bacterium]
MITNYKQLTGKYLKGNKKRTILTIIGIILSIALISSIGLFLKGLQDLQIEDMKRKYGSYHVAYEDVNESLALKLRNNPKVSRSGMYRIGEEMAFKDLPIEEVVATDAALELAPYRIKEGKFPNGPEEVAAEKWVLDFIDNNIKIGDKIKIEGKEYKLVGILDDVMKNQMDFKGMLLRKEDKVETEGATMLVEINPKANLKKAVKELRELVPEGKAMENAYLLEMQGAGGFNSSLGGLYITVAIIIGIVVIATIAVIYNAFYISVVERIKQFGLLRAVGATPKQIKNIVFREATILALIGIPIGLLCGVIAIYGIGIAFDLLAKDMFGAVPLKFSISPKVLGISALLGLVTIYISAFIPAHFAGKLSPLLAISSRNSITKENIKRRKSLIMGTLFGFEGALASKNIKRNKKRYRATIFSIAISVVLFITFKSFMDMSLNVGDNLNESSKTSFSIVRNNDGIINNFTIDEAIIKDLKGLSSVDKVYKVYFNHDFLTVIDKNKENKDVQNIEGIYEHIKLDDVDKTLMRSSMAIYDDEALEASKKYLKSGSIDKEKLNKENGVILIDKNRVYNTETQNSFYGPVANMKVGDEIELQYSDSSQGELEFGKGKVKKVKIMAILENDPFNFRGSQQGLKMVTTEEVAKNLSGVKEINPSELNIIIKDDKSDKNGEKAKGEIEGVVKSNTSLRIINYIDANAKGNSAVLMVKILLYGFVIVVSLISSVNIVNTLTTNIILRKREFGTLKAIGLTQKGLKKMIILEGFLYGIVGTIYGSIIGSTLSYAMFGGMSSVREFGWRIPWSAIGIAGIAALIIGYISVLAPLRRIEKENVIEAIREEF